MAGSGKALNVRLVVQVFCDRHFGGINYPVGGVGKIPETVAEGGWRLRLGGCLFYQYTALPAGTGTVLWACGGFCHVL